jgi:hypothetical protein
MSNMSWSRAAGFIAVVGIIGCAKDKPAADNSAAAQPQGLPAPDTIKATPVAVPDTTKMAKQADTKGAASKGVPATVPPRVAAPTKTKAKSKIIGRDSVDTKPKLIGLPVVRDTAKPKPPR